MSERISLTPLLQLLLAGACSVIIISGLKAASAVVNPLLLALLIVPMILPVQQWLIRRGVARAIATAVAVLVLIAGLLGVIFFVGSSVAEMATRLPMYTPKFVALRDSLFAELQRRGIDTLSLTTGDTLDPQRVIAFASSTARILGHTLADALFIVLLLAFALPILARGESEHEKQLDRERAVALQVHFAEMRKYVAITGLCGLINGTVALGLLLYLRIDFAVTWAVLFFLMNFVPAVGFVFALVPPLLLTLVQYGWTSAIVLTVFYSVLHFLVDSVFKPSIMAEGLDLSPLVVIVALVFWAWVLGPIGAIVAVPITMVLRKFAGRYASDSAIIIPG